MFWLAEILTILAALVGIALIRAGIIHQIPGITERHLDILLILLLLTGVPLTIKEYLAQARDKTALSTEVQTLKNYSDVAQLTFNGSPYIGGDIEFNTELTLLLKGTFNEIEPNRYRRVCTSEAQQKRLEAMKRFPRFPFSHYWFALCLRDQGDQQWQVHAQTALAIFQRTTQIAGHQTSHDEAKAYLEQILSNSPHR
jgi:hypothetical protein